MFFMDFSITASLFLWLLLFDFDKIGDTEKVKELDAILKDISLIPDANKTNPDVVAKIEEIKESWVNG